MSVDCQGFATVVSRHKAREHDEERWLGYSGPVRVRTKFGAGEPGQPRPMIITPPIDDRDPVLSGVRMRIETQKPRRDLTEGCPVGDTAEGSQPILTQPWITCSCPAGSLRSVKSEATRFAIRLTPSLSTGLAAQRGSTNGLRPVTICQARWPERSGEGCYIPGGSGRR